MSLNATHDMKDCALSPVADSLSTRPAKKKGKKGKKAKAATAATAATRDVSEDDDEDSVDLEKRT